jgi:hypothetical protein
MTTYYYFSKPVSSKELVAKLEPYGIGANPVEYVPGMIDYIVLHHGVEEREGRRTHEQELWINTDLRPDYDMVQFLEVSKFERKLPETILNAVREVAGELLTEKQLERRAEKNPHDEYLQYVLRGPDEADHDRWLEKCREMHPDLFDDDSPYVNMIKVCDKAEREMPQKKQELKDALEDLKAAGSTYTDEQFARTQRAANVLGLEIQKIHGDEQTEEIAAS